ncbi:hypothetical protein Tco_0579067, partial [Tanacetum coccineum]
PEVTPFVESKEWIETNNELYKMMEDFTERMNQELHKQEVLLTAQREKELLAQKQATQENALNFKLLLINLNSQHLDKEKQEVKNIAEPTAKQPEDSLIMGNEELSTIPEKESDEFIKSSVKDLIPIPRESEDTSDSDSVCVLPSSDDFSPIFEEKSVTFSNPLFDSNNFTSSDNELLSDEDVPEDVKIYSNSFFEFDDEYISKDVNPLFDEVLENIESKDSYVSNLDEPALLVTPLFDANKDECFDLGGVIDEIDAFLDMDISTDIENDYHDSEGD